MNRLSVIAVAAVLLLAGCFDLQGTNGPAVAHAATYVVGGKKGWKGVKSWTVPSIASGDVLTFRWSGGPLAAIMGRKHSVGMAADAATFDGCQTKASTMEFLIKPAKSGKKSITLAGNDYRFMSTVGKDCAKGGMKLAVLLD